MLLDNVERLDRELRNLRADLQDCLADLTGLSTLPVHSRREAEEIDTHMRTTTVDRSAAWQNTRLMRQTLQYASDPLLKAEEGLLFVPTPLFLARYTEHTQTVRAFWKELWSHCDVLVGLVGDALKGPARKSVTMGLVEIDALAPDAFEKFVGMLLDRDGFHILRSGGGAGDEGADVLAADALGRRIMVQCKHSQRGGGSVGQPVVQHLYGGAVADHPSTLPVLVTNGRITEGARKWAEQNNRVRLILRDDLQRWGEHGEPLADILKGTGSA
ncbi:restriction endonuclease [Streptomyces zaomyceticus]|uniref:restriction endonuclease n=1 Tax=Streptomyces zaomyceticus TaxID=68286 RepID=UPI0036906342